MGNKMTPSQQVGGVIMVWAFCLASTALVWKWPEYSTWFMGVALALIAVFLLFVYRAARKASRPGVEK
jgi:membrane protein implicated in regulation of membrane protease activity